MALSGPRGYRKLPSILALGRPGRVARTPKPFRSEARVDLEQRLQGLVALSKLQQCQQPDTDSPTHTSAAGARISRWSSATFRPSRVPRPVPSWRDHSGGTGLRLSIGAFELLQCFR